MGSFTSFLSGETSEDPPASESSSTAGAAGIFYKDLQKGFAFKAFTANPHLPDPCFFSIPSPFTICSSSNGLLLCYSSLSNAYHVFNPFIHNPSTSYRLVPSPPRSHNWNHTQLRIPKNSPAVLSVEATGSKAPIVFNIISAVHEGDCMYSFDWYGSSADHWNTRKGSIDISPTNIREDTGISNDMGMGFWLTYDGDAIIGFNTMDGSTLKIDLKGLPVQILDSPTVMQLGKVDKTKIGLAAAYRKEFASTYETRVILFAIKVDREKVSYTWDRHKFLNAKCCRNRWLGLVRFEKDVPLLMRYNRIALWEVSHWLENRSNASLRQIPWPNIPLQICDSVPYTYSNIVPPKITWMSRLKEKIFVRGW